MFYMVAVQFEDVGADGVASFDKLIKMNGIDAVSYDDMETLGAEIQVREGAGYNHYYYINDAYDADGNEVTGWADGNGDQITDADLQALGNGFWFIARNATAGASITVAGQVSAAAEMTIDFPGSNLFSIRANPYPVGIDFGKMKTSGIDAVSYDDMETLGAEIQVREGSGYNHYYYINDAYDADGNEVTAWADGNGDEATGVSVEVGSSFWIKSPKAGSFTFSL